MKHYSVMPSDWDYTQQDKIKELNSQGCHTPCQIEEVVKQCGSLFPFITTKQGAIEFIKNLKAQFPFVRFDLMVGKTWGEMELVKSF